MKLSAFFFPIALGLAFSGVSCTPPGSVTWTDVGTGSAPAFLNGWHNYAAAEQGLSFGTSTDGFLHIIGTIQDTTPTTSIENVFLLPTGFRPNRAQYFTITAFSGITTVLITISILPDGRFVIGGNPAPDIVFLGHLIVPMN
jgi:hypothetical protein